MSIIFGVRKPKGEMVAERLLQDLAQTTASWASDGTFVYARANVGMGFQPYHTHQRSELESQPVINELGDMITLDGRLDNHIELCELLDIEDRDRPDSLIAMKAFKRWGPDCFVHFIGDWALAIWSQMERSLYLARDSAGARTLYYEATDQGILWSTSLDMFFVGKAPRDLNKIYAANYLSSHPVGVLTPYKGVNAVPPAHFLVLSEERIVVRRHWQWEAGNGIAYKSDSEYEEHFLMLFRQSVARRIGSGAPILAQLSGGLDSTSIVCMADSIRATEAIASNSLIDTISYFDDSEPSWNEYPYFSLVEQYRKKTGIHIRTSFLERTFEPCLGTPRRYRLPGADSGEIDREARVEAQLAGRGYRAVLSGIGGDELLGGVANPAPELAEYLASGNLGALFRQAISWSIAKREPLVKLAPDVLRHIGRLRLSRSEEFDNTKCPWVRIDVGYATKAVPLSQPISRLRMSLRDLTNEETWRQIMETLPHLWPAMLARREYRYPFLDRDLVEYLLRLPREQLVRPNRRRSLMRRALATIVPSAVLERRRKAYLIRGPLSLITEKATMIRVLFSDSLCEQLGLVDSSILLNCLEDVVTGRDVTAWPGILRVINFELWLRSSTELVAKHLPLS